MSDETRKRVAYALRAHLLDECDGEPWLMTDWLAILAARSADLDRTTYLHVRSEAPFHVHLGLADTVLIQLRASWVDRDL